MSAEMRFIIYDKSREEFQIPWTGKALIIGRRADAEIRLNEPTMSGLHARIFSSQDGVRIRDLDSLNGTHVNGDRIVETDLQPGDQIKIGRAMIVVSGSTDTLVDPGSGSASTELEDVLDAVGTLDGPLNTQTVKISLDQLRRSHSEQLDEGGHIFLLSNLFEALEEAENQEEVLRKVREVLKQAFRRARVFIFLPTATGDWQDPEVTATDRRPSLTFAVEAARTSSAILSASLPDDKRFKRSESARISGIETAIAAAASCEGEPVALFYVDRLGLPPFSRSDLSVLGIAVNHVTAVLERMSRIEAIHRTNAELMEARESLAELNRNLERLVEERTAEIKRQAEEIKLLAEAKDELLGIAAHDIRGPLTVIQGTSDLLRLRVDDMDSETMRRSLDLMHGACRGLTRLLSELLDAKAIEAGKITLHLRSYSVRSLIEEALPAARLAAEDKSVELKIEAEPELHIDADPQRLAQAITNLALNAVKFSASGTRILLRGAIQDEDLAMIEVEDQGVGIPADELEGIFGRFQQGQAGKQFGGSGLGLMIARRIVELHGGTLSVKSQIGVGTRFTLALPRRARGAETSQPLTITPSTSPQ